MALTEVRAELPVNDCVHWIQSRVCEYRSIKFTCRYFHIIKTLRNLTPVLFSVTLVLPQLLSVEKLSKLIRLQERRAVKCSNFIAASV